MLLGVNVCPVLVGTLTCNEFQCNTGNKHSQINHASLDRFHTHQHSFILLQFHMFLFFDR